MTSYLDNIQEPTLVLDKQKCLVNIQNMNKKAKENNLIFRPHFKTHQSEDIANWFRQFGIKKCTVSSVRMAEYFIHHHWKDITIAFPFNMREIKKINVIEDDVKINLLISEKETAVELVRALRKSVGVFLKIDSGYHRAGIQPDNFEKIDAILEILQKSVLIEFKGFLTHAGHSYKATNEQEILAVHQESLDIFKKLRKIYQHKYPNLIVSIGDTPTCSVANSFEGIDEIRPGNFVFYDNMQYNISSCKLEDIAIVMACPIVEKHVSREEMLIYGGAVHFSKDAIESNGFKSFGLIVRLTDSGWEFLDSKSYLKSVSQEHGVIQMDRETMKEFNIGDLIGVIPVHSCLAANLMKRFVTVEGENFFIDI